MKDENALLHEAYDLYIAGMPGASLAVCEEIKTRPDHSAHAYYYAGLACIHLGRIDQAVAELKEAVQREPDNAHYYSALATAYSNDPFRRAERAQALREVSLLRIETAPEWERQLTQGMLVEAERDWNRALFCYHLALPDAPDPQFVHTKIGQALYYLGRWEEARDVMRDVASHPTGASVSSWLTLGRIEWRLRHLGAAADAFERAAAIDPYDGLALFRLVQVSFARGQWLPGFRHIKALWRILYQTAAQEGAALKKSPLKKSTSKG